MFPRVTGIWFQSHQLAVETGAPRNFPAGMTNIFTMECSYPCAKKVVMGSHIATILPMVERETRASTAPTVTIQLQRTALMNAVAHPLEPAAIYPRVFFCAASRTKSPSAPPLLVPQFVIAR